MDIPKIDVETYRKKLPSSGEMILIRPALVKEEKIYLMGKESENPNDLLDALIRVTQNCIIEPSNFSVEEMSYNDFIWTFVEIMKISKGESMRLNIPCEYCFNDEEKTEPFIELNLLFKLSEIEKIENVGVNKTKIVKLKTDIGVELKYTKVKYLRNISKREDKDLVKNKKIAEMEMIQNHVVAFLKGDTRHEFASPEEAVEWTDNNLKKADIEKIKEWFINEPRPIFDCEWTCSHCKKVNKSREGGLLRFLDL